MSRKMITGFPPCSETLPEGIEKEDIIKNYPNHLHGEVLLQIAEFWTPKEISTTSGLAELKPNTITKRIRAARAQRDGAKRKSIIKAKMSKKVASQEESTSTTRPSQTSLPNLQIESEASLNFRVEQQELQNIIEELDPTWAKRQGKKKKSASISNLDRELVLKAVEERERRQGL